MKTASENLTAEQVIDTWDYQNNESIVIPYNPNLKGVFPESFLCELYAKVKKDDSFRRMFPGSSDFSLNWFVSYFYNKTMIIALKKPSITAGFGWIYEIDGNERFRKASIGFMFFREYWGENFIYDAARLCLRWFFEQCAINVIYATIAAWNRPSSRFAKIMGFELIGRCPDFFLLPSGPVDIDLMVLKRENFFSRKER